MKEDCNYCHVEIKPRYDVVQSSGGNVHVECSDEFILRLKNNFCECCGKDMKNKNICSCSGYYLGYTAPQDPFFKSLASHVNVARIV